MTEQEQATLEADKASEEAKDAEAEGTSTEEAGEATDKAPFSDNIDYKAIAERESKARIEAEKILAEQAFKNRKQKREEEETEEEPPLSREELKQSLAQQNEATQKIVRESQAQGLFSGLAKSTDEANALLETWKNRKFPAGMSLEEQAEETYVIVNRKRIIGENKELMRALKGKGIVNDNPAVTHNEGLKPEEPRVSADVKSVLTAQGFAFNQATGRYEKKLKNGQTLVKNIKTNKIFIAELPQAPANK